jgi:serine/threonine protein kinase
MDPSILTTFISKRENIETGFYGKKVDIWSLGVLTYKLLLGNIPFNGDNLKELIDFINDKNFIFPMKEGNINQNIILSEDAILFIDKIINTEKNCRPTADTLVNDNWFKNNEDHNKNYFCLKTYEEISILTNKKNFINFWKIIPKKSKDKSTGRNMSQKMGKKNLQKIINITRVKPIEMNTLKTSKTQKKSYFKLTKNGRKIIKIESIFFNLGKHGHSRSIEIKKRNTMPLFKNNRIIKESIRSRNKYNMMINSYIPRITNYKTSRKVGLSKNNGNEKTNFMKNVNSMQQISFIEKKRNNTEIKTHLKSNRNKYFFIYMTDIKKKMKSKIKKISIIDNNDDFNYSYKIKDLCKSI